MNIRYKTKLNLKFWYKKVVGTIRCRIKGRQYRPTRTQYAICISCSWYVHLDIVLNYYKCGYYRELGYRLLRSFKVTNYKNEISLVDYITEITEEITTFADDPFFPTPEEEVLKRLEFRNVMNNEAKNV
jgi:hypothetical protein